MVADPLAGYLDGYRSAADSAAAGAVLAELAASQPGVMSGPTLEPTALSEVRIGAEPDESIDGLPTAETTELADEAKASGEREPLTKLVRKGLTWSLAGMLIGRVGTLVTGIVLARLLSPDDYGVFAVALVALVFISNLNDLGIEQALVRWPNSIDGVAPTGKTVILASSVIQFAVLFVGAPTSPTPWEPRAPPASCACCRWAWWSTACSPCPRPC